MYDNWQRPGALTNCTVTEFENAVFEDDKYIVKVHEHNTGMKGSAKLCLNADMHKRTLQE